MINESFLRPESVMEKMVQGRQKRCNFFGEKYGRTKRIVSGRKNVLHSVEINVKAVMVSWIASHSSVMNMLNNNTCISCLCIFTTTRYCCNSSGLIKFTVYILRISDHRSAMAEVESRLPVFRTHQISSPFNEINIFQGY